MLNKQGPGKIDFCEYSWNPISGCLFKCSYCYMKRMEKRFPGIMKPDYRERYLDDLKKLKKPSNIFVGSSGDAWGDWVPEKHIQNVLDVVTAYPQHRFQFLTKNPRRYDKFVLPKNGIYGTTVDGTEKTVNNLVYLVQNVQNESKIFVSFEPLLKRIPLYWIIKEFEYLDWIIIGANSNRGAKKPPLHWAGALIALAREYKIPVFVKDNYHYPERFKEMPEWNSNAAIK